MIMAKRRSVTIRERNTLTPVSEPSELCIMHFLTLPTEKCYDNHGKEVKCENEHPKPEPGKWYCVSSFPSIY